MNIALISYNIIRMSQTLSEYYVNEGDKVYHFLLTKRKRLDYPTKGEVIYLNKHKVSESNFVLFAMDMLDISKEIKQLKKKYNIDVAISFMEIFNLLNVLSKGKERCIVSVRTTLSLRKEFAGYEYRKWIIGSLYNRANKIVTAGDYSKNDLILNYNVRKKKVISISNPAICHSKRAQSTEKWVYGNKVVISVTRFDSVKQVDLIIRAFSYVNMSTKDAKLILLGEGKEKEYLVNEVQRLKLDEKVLFLGHKENVDYYLKNSRVFVMASRVEGFPNAMVEAMANGLPIVTTDTPGSCQEILGKEITTEENIRYCEYGILTPYMDFKKNNIYQLEKEEITLGEAILSVLENDTIYERYVSQSLVRSKEYDYDKIMQEWNMVLRK